MHSSVTDASSSSQPRHVIASFLGILVALLAAILSTSTITTSLPAIAADIGGAQTTITWVVTSSLLAVTVSTPLWGKLSDLFERKIMLQCAVVMFAIGSLGAGLAPGPVSLSAFRAVQGFGTGGLLTLAQIVLFDLLSARDRGRYMGVMQAVIVSGTAGGPLLGGALTESFGWRWNFLILVPAAAGAAAAIQWTLRLPPGRRGRRRIDAVGAVLLTTGAALALTWLSLGGRSFSWGSPVSIAMAATAGILLVALIAVERRVSEPILPLRLLRAPTYALGVVVSFSAGTVIFTTSVYLSQYLQLSRGASALDAGLFTLPQVAANLAASTLIGFLISRTGRWKHWLVIGAALVTAASLVFSTLRVDTPYAVIVAGAALTGLGLGMTLQTIILAVQNSADPRDVGAASSGVAFARSLGGAVAVASFGALLTAVSDSSSGDREAAYAAGIGWVFLLTAPIAAVGLLCAILLPDAPLSRRTGIERRAEEDPGDRVAP